MSTRSFSAFLGKVFSESLKNPQATTVARRPCAAPAERRARERKTTLAAVLAALALFAAPAVADELPGVRILNFTADWCPNCQILNPRMARAMESIGPTSSIQRFDLDFTDLRGGSDTEKANATADALRTLEAQQALYLWDYYAGYTGVAVVVASDSGEPLSCLTRALSSQQMERRLLTDLKKVRDTEPGTRFKQGEIPPNCP